MDINTNCVYRSDRPQTEIEHSFFLTILSVNKKFHHGGHFGAHERFYCLICEGSFFLLHQTRSELY